MDVRTMVMAALALALAGATAAATTATTRGDGEARRAGLLERLDTNTNRDGMLARDEVDAAARERAHEIDRDRDGAVTVAEIRAFRDARRSERQARRLARIDADHDGRVSVDELAAARTRFVMRFDLDGDGAISPAEREAVRERIRARRLARLAP